MQVKLYDVGEKKKYSDIRFQKGTVMSLSVYYFLTPGDSSGGKTTLKCSVMNICEY